MDLDLTGGAGGIRTLGRGITAATVFETIAISLSATTPKEKLFTSASTTMMQNTSTLSKREARVYNQGFEVEPTCESEYDPLISGFGIFPGMDLRTYPFAATAAATQIVLPALIRPLTKSTSKDENLAMEIAKK